MQFITELEPGKRLVADGEYVWVEVEGVVGEKRKMPGAATPIIEVKTVTSTLASIKYQDGTSVPVSVFWDEVTVWENDTLDV